MKVVSQGKKIIRSINERKKKQGRKRKYAVESDRNDQEKKKKKLKTKEEIKKTNEIMRQERRISHCKTEGKKRKNNKQEKNEREEKANECNIPNGKLFEKKIYKLRRGKKTIGMMNENGGNNQSYKDLLTEPLHKKRKRRKRIRFKNKKKHR